MLRPLLALGVVVSLLDAHPILAQTTASAPVTATVASRLLIGATGTTSFGTFDNSAHTETLAPWPGTATPPRTMALFTVTADVNRTMLFTCPATVALATNPAGAVMTFQPLLGVGSSTGSLAQAVTGCPGFTGTSSTGTYYLSLGGRIDVANNQAPGSYTGTFTLSVSY